MCGITGFITTKDLPDSGSVIRAMTDAIKHRGPDGEGYFLDGNIAIGHRRLSIIDLTETGNQPMFSEDSRYVISYNGEVYNFRELRTELKQLGYSFFSSTDTEVVLKAYIEWGEKCVNRFNGMFACVIYDKHKKTLFMFRDRYGIKPLYYTFTSSGFVFGSEIKAIQHYPDFKTAMDKEGLLEYFTFQNFFTNHTLYNGIRTFPAGHYCSIDTRNLTNSLSLTEYWDYQFEEPDQPSNELEYLEELDRLFRQAVKRQLVSDVELGCYLSGGMDSGSITAIASSEFPNMKTFTCGFDLSSASGMELAFDERSKAEFMSDKFKTEHYEMVLKSGDMERCMENLVHHIEEPRVGQSYPNYYAAKLAGNFVKVVLAGTGGDELFGGYPWRYYRAVVNDDFENYIDKYYNFWQRLIPDTKLSGVMAPIWNEVKHVSTRDIFKSVFKHHADSFSRPEDYVNHSLYFEAKTFLHGLLAVEDKLSMAHGLESRVPFLDNELVDFAMKIPVSLKLGNLNKVVELNENEPGPKSRKYFEKTRDGKLILRKMLKNYIPDSITDGVKQGFSAPDASWFKGESIEYVRSKLCSKNAKMYSYFDYSALIKLIDEHLSGKENRRLLLWSLLNFEQWLENTQPAA